MTQTAELPPHVAALLQPEAYDHPASEPQLRETHISWVILAGNFVYKLKKPVNLGFADFSTLEQREHDCREEVRLNRRLAPDVYLGLVHVVTRGGRYFAFGDGQPVEPAVRMRRLPEDGMLPGLLARDQVDTRLMRRIARRLARFHASAPTGRGVDEHGSIATIRGNWDGNFRESKPFVGRLLTAERDERIRAYVQGFLRHNRALLEQRVAHGRIREGHGDLHLASICLDGSRLVLFDCIEFAARFRCSDVAAEVAFLAMDLEHRGRADLASAFVDAYVRFSGDEHVRQLLGFYIAYRAFVRGKVLGMRLHEPGLAPQEARDIADDATAYFDLAWAYAGGFAGPVLLMSMGLPGSGKTTLAEALAARLGLVHISSDRLRKELAGLAATTPQREAFGAGVYDPAMTRRTYQAMVRRAGQWLRRGRSVVLDATYGNPDERAAVRRLAGRLGVRLVPLLADVEERVILDRMRIRETQSGVTSDARVELWPRLRDAFVPPTEMAETVRVSTAGTVAEVAARAIAALSICDQ